MLLYQVLSDVTIVCNQLSPFMLVTSYRLTLLFHIASQHRFYQRVTFLNILVVQNYIQWREVDPTWLILQHRRSYTFSTLSSINVTRLVQQFFLKKEDSYKGT